LGNREIGCQTKNNNGIFHKYYRKNVAQYALTVGNIGKNENEILTKINKSLCSCGRDPHYVNEDGIVEIKEDENGRHLRGLKSCGSNGACPVCASKLSAVRGNQLRELMGAGRNYSRGYIMLVTTVPHTPNEPLDITLNQVIEMSRYIFQRKEWREFKELTKCRFTHGGLENMVSFKNGLVDWHPHKNYLLDFDIPIKEIIQILGLKDESELRMYVSNLATNLGNKYFKLRKIDKKLLAPYFEKDKKRDFFHVKAGVSASLEFDDSYITKWGLDAEMTGSIYKDGRFNGGSFHPFNLLDLISSDNKDTSESFKFQCIKAFQEFVLASKGKWWFYFAKGAVDYYNENYATEIKVKSDEEELTELEDTGESIFKISFEEWQFFQPTPLNIGEALSKNTKQEVLEYIFEHIEQNRILEFYNTG